jgi:hypothetical protein
LVGCGPFVLNDRGHIASAARGKKLPPASAAPQERRVIQANEPNET